MSSVYVHITPKNKLYIGMTSHDDVEKRWGVDGKGYDGQVFSKAIQKYGWDNIQHIVLFSGVSKEVACECEKYLISKYKTQQLRYGYNRSDGGDTNAGYHHTEEYKENLRRNLLGSKQSEEIKRKKSESLKGHEVSKETREKIGRGNRGKTRTIEQRKRTSETHKGKRLGHEGYWKNKKFSDEHKEKIRQANLGKSMSEETKKKLSKVFKGKKMGPMSEEHKQKIRDAWKRKREALT